MKLITLLPLTLLSLVSANYFGGQATLQDENDLAVPGENPLKFCQAPDNDLLTILKVDLDPNPPEAGTALHIEAMGNFSEPIAEGAYVLLTIKYGLIRLLYQKEDLCEQMKNVDKKCPLEKGIHTLVKDVELPAQIPPGVYHVLADVYTVDDVKITCLTATVKFSP